MFYPITAVRGNCTLMLFKAQIVIVCPDWMRLVKYRTSGKLNLKEVIYSDRKYC